MESIDLYSPIEIMPKYGTIQGKLKELDTTIEGKGEVRGYCFKQLFKSDKAFLYQKSFEDIISYEVFRRMENKRYNCITYPGSKQFGLTAWDYSDYDKAIKKFNELSE